MIIDFVYPTLTAAYDLDDVVGGCQIMNNIHNLGITKGGKWWLK